MNKINGISKLEADILLVVWDRGKVTIREVYEAILRIEIRKKKSYFILYSNIQLNMNNLVKKKILKLDRTYKTHIYASKLSRKELTKAIIGSVAEKLL